MECCTFTHYYVLITTNYTSYPSMAYTKSAHWEGEIYVHVICMHPKHTHTHTCSYTSPYQHYHHNSHIHRVSFPNGIFIHVEGPFTIFGVCVYIVCECNVCVNMCVTPSSNLAPYSNHITGHWFYNCPLYYSWQVCC